MAFSNSVGSFRKGRGGGDGGRCDGFARAFRGEGARNTDGNSPPIVVANPSSRPPLVPSLNDTCLASTPRPPTFLRSSGGVGNSLPTRSFRHSEGNLRTVNTRNNWNCSARGPWNGERELGIESLQRDVGKPPLHPIYSERSAVNQAVAPDSASSGGVVKEEKCGFAEKGDGGANRSMDAINGDANLKPSLNNALDTRSPRRCASMVAIASEEATARRLPSACAGSTGTISLFLNKDVLVELSIDGSVRVSCPHKFAITIIGDGSASAILLPSLRVYHENGKVFCKFSSSMCAEVKSLVLSSLGMLFKVSGMKDAYLVSHFADQPVTAVNTRANDFPALDCDITLHLFYSRSLTGVQAVLECNEIVRKADFRFVDDGTLVIYINGAQIKQLPNGDVQLRAFDHRLECSPNNGSVRLRYGLVSITSQEDEKVSVTSDRKVACVSRSGMLFSDGTQTVSVDRFGRVLCS